MTGPFLLVLRLLLAISLYAFVGWAFLILWRDLQTHSQVAQRKAQPPAITLTSNETPKVFVTPVINIGRDPFCEYPLDDETTSARHARLSFHHGQWWAEDTESTNGTRLNDQPIIQTTVLTDGDILKCGNSTIHVHIETESSK